MIGAMPSFRQGPTCFKALWHDGIDRSGRIAARGGEIFDMIILHVDLSTDFFNMEDDGLAGAVIR